MKNKFLVIVLSIVFLLPFTVFATENTTEQTVPENSAVESVEQSYSEENTVAQSTLDEDTQEAVLNDNANKFTYKTPTSKRKLIKKFILAMLGVGISVFILFFILNLYDKLRNGLVKQIKTSDGENTLKTPDDMEDAIKTFLDKTNWKG